MKRWPRVKLADHVDLVSGYPFKSASFTANTEDVPLVKGENVHQGFIDWQRAKRWPKRETEGLEKYWLQAGDVILAMDRPWIEAGLKQACISGRDPRALLVQRVSRLRGTNGLSTQYLRYLISSSDFTDYIRPIVTGINVPHISAAQIKAFEFGLPPVATQRRIASILAAYDDLVENTTRRIAILEEMPRRIYDEWFVRFRFPGHETVRMVESELGPVPEGWDVVRLDQILVLQRGFDLPTKVRAEGPYPVVAATGVHGTHHEFKVKGPGVVTGRSGSLGTVVYMEDDFWPLNTTLWVKSFVVGSPLYAFYVLSRIDLSGFNSGAAVPTLNRNDIHGLPSLRPRADVLLRFDEVVAPIARLKRVLADMNQNLRSTRDLLLPRLISGELDVTSLSEPEAAVA